MQLQAELGRDIIHAPHEADLARHSRDHLNVMGDDVAIVAVAYPRTTAQVSRIMAGCYAADLAVVPQGGLTSMVGGAVPMGRALVLSLERIRGIEEIDPDAATMTVGAGTVLQTVQEAAEAADFFFPLDLGGRGSAQIGGTIATNAGGNRVLRFGMMRELVLGLEAVLPDGTVLTSLNKMLKNNAGYDLKQLFIGSEGTLGIVTRAVLRLYPQPLSRCTGLLAVAGDAELLGLLRAIKTAFAGGLSAFEVMWADFYALGTVSLGRRPPLAQGAPLYVLVETLGTEPEADLARFEEVLAAMVEQGLASDATVATSERQARELWDIRDCPGEFSKTFWPQRSFDVSLPVGRIGAFAAAVRQTLEVRWPTIRTAFWGHLADSNLHIALTLPETPLPEDAFDAVVLGLVRDWGGSISAEHGIGSKRAGYLHYSRTPEEIALMHMLKRSLDPKALLNPGKVIA